MKELKTIISFLILVFSLAILVNTASAGINITDAEAIYEANLSSVGIPTNPYPVKTIFTCNEEAIFKQGLCSVSILTMPLPIKEIFIVNEEATFCKNLYTVSIPTEPSPIKEMFIHLEEAKAYEDLVFPKELMILMPTVTIYTDKTNYTAGEKMYLGLDVKNPSDSAQKVSLDIYLETPTGGKFTLIDTTITLPAKLNHSNPHIKVFTLPSIPAGTYTWHALLDDPVTGEIICEDTAEWKFVSTKAPIEDITEMLEQTTTVIDFGE